MTKEKSFNIDGTVYAKNVRTVNGKKNPTKTYEFKSIILEVKSSKEIEREGGKQYVTKTTLLEFDIAPWVDIEPYSVTDFVDIRFIIEGNEFIRKDGTKAFINKLKATYIKYADIESEGERPAKANEPNNYKETVFITPDPGADDDNDNLPF